MRWVLSIAVGPVGRFISAGRRSRDLWWGSTWLSECSLAVAQVLRRQEGHLLVPSRARIDALTAPGSRLAQYGGRISNHLLMLIEAEDVWRIKEVAEEAERAARTQLCMLLKTNREKALSKLGKDQRLVRLDQLDQQASAIAAGDFLEFYAVWTPVEDADFQRALERATVLMDARKGARLFNQATFEDDGLRKSDLDPGRPTVLAEARDADQPRAERREANAVARLDRALLGIRPNEDLDAIGFARRIASFSARAPALDRLPFPPLSRVAADPWLNAAQVVAPDLLEHLRQHLEGASRRDDLFAVWCSPARDPDRDAGAPSQIFPFDASILLEDGLSALEAELGRVARDRARDIIHPLRAPVAALHTAMRGPPQPYLAVLAMDGDGVGNALHAALSVGEGAHEKLTAALDRFAERAPMVIAEEHGCAFYAAGDELLAFLPLDRALNLVQRLAREFSPVVEQVAELGLRDRTGLPISVSLSGGLVVGHLKHDLRDLREEANDALASAKSGRREADARDGWLELRELPRSGVARSCLGELSSLAASLHGWSQGIGSGALSMRTADKIFELNHRFAADPDEPLADDRLGVELLRSALASQERRGERTWALQHAATAGQAPDRQHFAQHSLEARVEALETWGDARTLAAELSIARRLARVSTPAGGES